MSLCDQGLLSSKFYTDEVCHTACASLASHSDHDRRFLAHQALLPLGSASVEEITYVVTALLTGFLRFLQTFMTCITVYEP